MGILKKASTETKRIELDDSDYIEVRADISKREFNILAGNMPTGVQEDGSGLSLTDATKFQEFLFGALVTGWSLPEKATTEAYNGLSAEAAQAVDEALAKHFESLMPTSAEGKSPTT